MVLRWLVSLLMTMVPLALGVSADDKLPTDLVVRQGSKVVETAEIPAERPTRPRIEIAVLLDTSGSMSGLIDQARSQLWKIVNEFEAARRNGQRADVYVALYEYGKSSLSAEAGWIRQIVPLTTDLDKISEELFALHTNGGEEYCGQVIDLAVRELEWSKEQADLKCIFIAGNEPFTQGTIDYKEACHLAANANITVSTIHCGSYDEGIQGMWADGAKLADGTYLNIDHNQVEPHIPSPQDEEISQLNTLLNATYCAYGSDQERDASVARQNAQDANASSAAPAAEFSRIATKAGRLYKNAEWDLIDAVEEKQVELTKLKKDQLPEGLRELSADDLVAHVEKLATERKEIQQKIKKLTAARAKFVADEREKLADSGENTLDEAIISAARAQAERQEFEFVEE
jgi:hypothetical protein